MEFIGYIALIGIGVILSLIGGGGSMLSMPILVYIFSLDVVTASSYSLFIVGTTSLFGAWLKQKEQWIDIRSGMIFLACSAVAIFSARKWIVPGIPAELFLFNSVMLSRRLLMVGVFAFLAIVSSVAILLKSDMQSQRPGPTKLKLLVPTGFCTGILVGFVGVGGGFLVLPSLIFFGGLPFKVALGTTLFIIGFNSLVGFLGDMMNYEINWVFLLAITGMATTGMLVGNFYSAKVHTRRLRKWFGWMVLTMAVGILVRELLF